MKARIGAVRIARRVSAPGTQKRPNPCESGLKRSYRGTVQLRGREGPNVGVSDTNP
jgi:hypothetical protein